MTFKAVVDIPTPGVAYRVGRYHQWTDAQGIARTGQIAKIEDAPSGGVRLIINAEESPVTEQSVTQPSPASTVGGSAVSAPPPTPATTTPPSPAGPGPAAPVAPGNPANPRTAPAPVAGAVETEAQRGQRIAMGAAERAGTDPAEMLAAHATFTDAGGRLVRLLNVGWRAADNSLLLHVTDGESEMLLTTGVGTCMVLTSKPVA